MRVGMVRDRRNGEQYPSWMPEIGETVLLILRPLVF
jgi:hypothetical protein